ncbi:hypothetical protein FRC06_004339, partial [Ceratobasidium sp. 370]
MPDLKWADLKITIDARSLTLRHVDGQWCLVDKDTGEAPHGLPRKLKDLGFVPCRKPKGSPGRGYPEGYNLQEKLTMSDVDYRIQQFVKVHPEYEAWRKHGFWNIRAGVQLILRTLSWETKKKLNALANVVKPHKKRGKLRAQKSDASVPTGQSAIADKPELKGEPAAVTQMASEVPLGEHKGAETFDFNNVSSGDEDEPVHKPVHEPVHELVHESTHEPADEPADEREGKQEDEQEDEQGDEPDEEPEPELALEDQEELGNPGALDVMMVDSSCIFGNPNHALDMSLDTKD